MHASSVTKGVVADNRAGIWSVGNDQIALTWQRSGSGTAALTSLVAGGRQWLAGPCAPFALSVDADAGSALLDVSAAMPNERASLRVTGRLEGTSLEVSVLWRTYADSPVLTGEITVVNGGDVPTSITSLSSLRLEIPARPMARLGVLTGGAWDASMPPGGYRFRTIELPMISGEGKPDPPFAVGVAADGRSSGEYVPWFVLFEPDGGMLAALAWSGRWRLRAVRERDRVMLTFGLADFSRVLVPGERLQIPTIVLSGFTGDLDEATQQWRRWIERHWMPPTPEDWPWVQYNHWYAYYGDIDETRLTAEAEFAAEAGCEVFVIDDGWFRGRRPGSYVAGWGDWRENPATFPHGLKAFGDRVRSLGMRFGLWVEPERVALSGSLAGEHPRWLAQRDGNPIARDWGGERGVHLCLGVLEVQEWMTTDLIRVVQEYGVDWLKWDYNIGYGLGCDRADHGHQTGDGHYAHTLGLYLVLERLRDACPGLVIENCASGGHRVDLGMLRHTHTSWLSDYTHRAASCRQHGQGAGYALPIPHLNTWVLEQRDRYEFRSRMVGALGCSSRLGNWSAAERRGLAEAVAEYKRLRPLLAGRRYLLTGPLHQGWDICQFVDDQRDRFALLAFRDAELVKRVEIRLRGLRPEATYRLEFSESDQDQNVTGAHLMDRGFLVGAPAPRGSTLIWGQVTVSQ